jgi:hypothetical protein
MNYVMFKPIADRLLADDRIEVVFTANHVLKNYMDKLGGIKICRQ